MKFNKLEKEKKALVYYLLIRDNQIALEENLPNNTCRFLEATIVEMSRAIKRWGFKDPKKLEWNGVTVLPIYPKFPMTPLEMGIFYDSFEYDCSRIKELFVK
jgi:hypothetical protein